MLTSTICHNHMIYKPEYKKIDEIGALEIFILDMMPQNMLINYSNYTIEISGYKYSIDEEGNIVKLKTIKEITQREYYEGN